MNILELSEQEIVRRQSLQTLREMGIDPYPAAEFPTNAFSTDIKAEFKHGMLKLFVPKKEWVKQASLSCRTQREESRSISPATRFVQTRTRTFIILYSRSSSTSVTSSV